MRRRIREASHRMLFQIRDKISFREIKELLSSSKFDEDGIFYGTNIYNDSLVFIDRYDEEKYKNANMCIFGTSGSGKSFFTKLLILRSRLFGVEQYVIDPEREYINLCEKLGGTLIKLGPASNTYINVFDIRKESIEEDSKGYLSTKISKLIGFFNLISPIKIYFPLLISAFLRTILYFLIRTFSNVFSKSNTLQLTMFSVCDLPRGTTASTRATTSTSAT